MILVAAAAHAGRFPASSAVRVLGLARRLAMALAVGPYRGPVLCCHSRSRFIGAA